jgi:hypothetical protein
MSLGLIVVSPLTSILPAFSTIARHGLQDRLFTLDLLLEAVTAFYCSLTFSDRLRPSML